MSNGGIIGLTVPLTSSSTSGVLDLNDKLNIDTNNVINNRQLATNGLVMWLDATNLASYPGNGNTWFDLSGSGLNATGSSAITGQALSANQPYTTATTSILNNDVHSIFFSIQITGSTGTWDKIFGYTPSGSDRSPGIWRYPSNKVIHWRYDPGNSDVDFSSTATGGYMSPGTEFIDNTWYYVGVSKNGSSASVYVNGVKLGDRTGVSNPKTAGTSTVQLYPGYTGTSRMRHVHIYNRVITDQEVLSNYNAIRSTLI